MEHPKRTDPEYPMRVSGGEKASVLYAEDFFAFVTYVNEDNALLTENLKRKLVLI